MAQASNTKTVTPEAALVNAVTAKVREGQYEIVVTEVDGVTTKTLNENVRLVVTPTEASVRKVLFVGEKEFSGKEVRVLDKAIEKHLNPTEAKARGGKKKEPVVTEEEAQALLDSI